MEKMPYYAITVRRYNILFRHTEWFHQTQALYNEVLLFYYQLYLETFPDEQPGTQEALRIMEKLTIVGRDKQPVPNPLPWKKVPLYFRRAAINTATAAAKSYLARDSLKKDRVELHIPWKVPVTDGRSARERITAENKICSTVFTGQDACAVCCILDSAGKRTSSFYIKGGREYANASRQIYDRIKRSEDVQGGGGNAKANYRYWKKLKNLHEHYAHQFSRQIIDYCKEQNASILVLPEYNRDHGNIIQASVGKSSPLRLVSSIREKLKYKAWQEGIVVLEVQQHNINSVCSRCGAKIRRKGADFQCENGHRGSRYLNMAQNLGQKCLDSFKENQKNK